MLNYKMSLWIGVLITLLPFLGIPQSWKHLVLFTIGLLLVAAALVARREQCNALSTATTPVDDTPSASIQSARTSAYASAYDFETTHHDRAPEPQGYVSADAFPHTMAVDSHSADAPKVRKPRKKRVAIVDVTPHYDDVLVR
ncbi:MAG: hypothetical protein RL150_489 [Candidatus Parcubacteria bacterium]|jgi:hypothetical protein